MKVSEMQEAAKAQAMQPKAKPVQAGDYLAGDHFARREWRAMIERGDPTMSRLASAHSAFWQGHQNLRAATETRDPEMTEDAHFMRTRKLGEDWLKRSGDQAMTAMQLARTEIEAERRAMVADLGLVENHRAGEVRGFLRGLSDAERLKVLAEAVEHGDAATIAAVVDAPAYLSGMKREDAAGLRYRYERKHAADRLARIEAIQKGAEVLDRTVTEAVVFANKLHPQHRADAITRKQQAAAEMRAKLATSI